MKKILVLVIGVLLFGINAYAADGDLIVNGNVGVGTSTPTQRLDVDGYVKGRSGVCIGDDCTSTLHVSAGLYGYCKGGDMGSTGYCGNSDAIVLSPMSCVNNRCACPAGYTLVQTGQQSLGEGAYGFYSCFKN